MSAITIEVYQHTLSNKMFVFLFLMLFHSSREWNEIKYVEEYANLPPVNFELADAIKSDVQYRLFTNATDNEGIILGDESVTNFPINTTLSTKLFIHGWTTNERSSWYDILRKAYFQKGRYNILYIDWSKAGGKEYIISAANVNPVGEYIADFLLASKIDLRNIHVIGHSLGSQLAGFIGKHIFRKTSRKIGRITAPDPGGPMFEHENMTENFRLNSCDADFVDVIHTDIGHYGYIAPIGHVDFYPNGGVHQPGCPSLQVDDNCSHARSVAYFMESVNSTNFKARKCKSWNDYLNGNFSEDDEIVFGDDTPKDVRGIYYFATNSTPPFAIG